MRHFYVLLLPFALTFGTLMGQTTTETHEEWFVDQGTVTTKIVQENENEGEIELYAPIIILRYDTPEESGGGGGGGGGEERSGPQPDINVFGIRNSKSTLDFIFGNTENDFHTTIAEFSENGSARFFSGLRADGGLVITGGLTDFQNLVWVRSGNKVGIGSIPQVQTYDFTVSMESEFTELLHLTGPVWAEPGTKVGIGTSSSPSAQDKDFTVSAES